MKCGTNHKVLIQFVMTNRKTFNDGHKQDAILPKKKKNLFTFSSRVKSLIEERLHF